MRFSLKLSVLIFLILNSILLLPDEALVDSVFLAPPPYAGEMSTYTPTYDLSINYYRLLVGDTGVGMIPPYAPNATMRSFLTFPISELDIENNYDLVELVLYTGLEGFNLISGNDVFGEWPEWDIAGGDTIKLWLDHVDFGTSLDIEDWTAGDPNSSQTIESKCAYITEDNYNPETGFIIVDVTEQILNDLQQSRHLSQFRLKFDCDTDNDSLFDEIGFARNSTIVVQVPHLNCLYTESNSEDNEIPESISKISNYPNPFNPQTTISYSITEPGNVQLQVFNIKGQLIETLVDDIKDAGNHTVEWKAESQASGIYLYRITSGRETKTGRCLLLK